MNAMVRILMLVVLGAFILAGAPGTTAPAQAACDNSVQIDDALPAANAVFVGEVISLSDQNRVARMRVLEVWKGRDLPGTVEVLGSEEGSSAFGPDDRTFQLGRTYLVLSDSTRSPFDSNRCSATKLYNPVGGRVIPPNFAAVIGVSTARSPLASPGGESDTGAGGGSYLPYINIALVLVGLVAAISVLRKLSNPARRVPQKSPQPEPERSKRKSRGPDSIGKISRRFSVSGVFGRSGLESSRKLRGRRQLRRAKGSSRRG